MSRYSRRYVPKNLVMLEFMCRLLRAREIDTGGRTYKIYELPKSGNEIKFTMRWVTESC